MSVNEFTTYVHHEVLKHTGRVGLRYYVYWHADSCRASTQGCPVEYEVVAAPGYINGIKWRAAKPGPSPNVSLKFDEPCEGLE